MSKPVREKIDEYSDTIYAIIGFANLYRYDDQTKKMRDDVYILQGWRLVVQDNADIEEKISIGGLPLGIVETELIVSDGNNNISANDSIGTNTKDKARFVTPDIAVLLPGNKAVIGEVKRCFPKSTDKWKDDFEQLMSYDADLSGWPNETGTITSHDIAFLIHQSRSRRVLEYLSNHNGVKFNRPFGIVEFNRSSETNEFFFFRREHGTFSDEGIDKKLHYGVEVPMKALVGEYSTIKFYDSEPPLPYLLELIWVHIIAQKACESPKFIKLRKNQKIDVDLEVQAIVQELRNGFSFALLLPERMKDRQPKVPDTSWIRRACEELVRIGDATWIGSDKQKISVHFQKREKLLDYFIEQMAPPSGQADFFPDVG